MSVNHLAFLPWQQDAARQWLGAQDRFAHAWLIHGMPGIGQLELAWAGAASLLCEAPRAGLACGACEACRWFGMGNHPDFRCIRPDALSLAEEGGAGRSEVPKQASRDIRVDQIRSLLPWSSVASHRGGRRVILLYPAESLNAIAANALLKILEEPPGATVFLLVAHAPDRLLPTLVSRCRRLPLPVPPHDAALAWLEEQGVDQPAARLAAAGGAPLLARESAQAGRAAVADWLDLFLGAAAAGEPYAAVADALIAQDPVAWVDAAQRLWADLGLAAHGLPVRYYPDRAQAITRLARRLDRRTLAQTVHWLQEQRRLAEHTLNPRFFADLAARTLLDRAAGRAAPI